MQGWRVNLFGSSVWRISLCNSSSRTGPCPGPGAGPCLVSLSVTRQWWLVRFRVTLTLSLSLSLSVCLQLQVQQVWLSLRLTVTVWQVHQCMMMMSESDWVWDWETESESERCLSLRLTESDYVWPYSESEWVSFSLTVTDRVWHAQSQHSLESAQVGNYRTSGEIRPRAISQKMGHRHHFL